MVNVRYFAIVKRWFLIVKLLFGKLVENAEGLLQHRSGASHSEPRGIADLGNSCPIIRTNTFQIVSGFKHAKKIKHRPGLIMRD
jgi:hypothetical protein